MFQYIHLTWICRRWRILVLEHAEFWTNIELAQLKGGVQMIEEFMTRSKGAKLEITLDAVGYFTSEGQCLQLFKQLIGPQFGRLKSLDLKLNSEGWEQIIPILQQPAPSLRHCHLTHHDDRYFVTPETIIALPSDLFKGTAQLRNLKLCDIYPSWSSIRSVIHGLRRLTLITTSNSDTARPTRERVLHILEGCPYLEMLYLRTHSPAQPPANAHAASPSITMPRLWNIHLVGNGDACFLGDISTPLLRRLYLKVAIGAPTMLPDWVARCLDFTALQEVAVGPDTANSYSSSRFLFLGRYDEGPTMENLQEYESEDLDKLYDHPLRIDCSSVDYGTLQAL